MTITCQSWHISESKEEEALRLNLNMTVIYFILKSIYLKFQNKVPVENPCMDRKRYMSVALFINTSIITMSG